MPLSSRTWEKSSQKDLPFDPPESAHITMELSTSGKGKRRINQYSKDVRIGKGRHGEVYLCYVEDDPDRKAVRIRGLYAFSGTPNLKLPSRPLRLSNVATPGTKSNC